MSFIEEQTFVLFYLYTNKIPCPFFSEELRDMNFSYRSQFKTYKDFLDYPTHPHPLLMFRTLSTFSVFNITLNNFI